METIFEKIITKQAELLKLYTPIEGLPTPPIDVNTKQNQKLIKDFFYRMIEEMGEAFDSLETLNLRVSSNDTSNKVPHTAQEFLMELGDFTAFFFEVLVLIGIDEAKFIEITSNQFGGEFTMDDIFDIAWKSAGITNYNDGMIVNMIHCNGINSRFEGITFLISNQILEYLVNISFYITYYLTKAGNCLKNKNWNQSEQLVKVALFEESLVKAFFAFIKYCHILQIFPSELYSAYAYKNEVNKKRIADGY